MPKKTIVNKFGGGIMTAKFIPLIAKRLREQIKGGFKPIAVVSALPAVTDELLSFCRKGKIASAAAEKFAGRLLQKHLKLMVEIGVNEKWREVAKAELGKVLLKLKKDLAGVSSRGPTNAQEDKIAACGEKMSAIFLAGVLNAKGLAAKRFFAEEIPVITDDNFKNAHIKFSVSEKNSRKKFLNLKVIPVVTGFTGKTANGKITTLGRGGTDTTACFTAAALRADKVILWKDVGAVLAADPKIVPTAKILPFVSYNEAEESGKIIHEKAIQYVKMHQTPVEISSLINPKIKTSVGPERFREQGAKIVSFRKNLILFIITDEDIKMGELITQTCGIFSKYKMNIILISNARYILQIVADNENGQAGKIFKELKSKVAKVEALKVNMIFLVGSFNVNDVNNFNNLLIKHKTGLEISAFLYENCARIEAIIKNDKIESIVRVLYDKFIK